MPWAPVIAAGIGAAGSMIAANSSKGSTASSQPSSMWQMMPGWAQDKYKTAMTGMPNTMNIGFGGQTYPSVYGPFHRAATAIFPPQGAVSQGATPGNFASSLSAGMPWAMMAMNNAKLWMPSSSYYPGQYPNDDPYGMWNI